MPETVTVGGKKYPKTLLYVGGAVTVGIVGYAWISKGTQEQEEFLTEADIDAMSDTPQTPILDSSRVQVDTRSGVKDNAEWTNFALEKLTNIGIEGPTASSAIGKFLQKKSLTKVEADLVRQAIAVAGYPPDGGPWSIIEEPMPSVPPPTMGKLAAPNPVSASPMGSAHTYVQWAAVPGAKSYNIRRSNVDNTGQTGWVNVGNKTSDMAIARVSVPTAFAYQVQAVNDAGPGDIASSNHVMVQP